jgi:hypothetical protein
VKVELPVLVATDRASFEVQHPNGLRLLTDWDIGGKTLRTEHIVTALAVREDGPTFVFSTVAVQDGRSSAPVRAKVSTAALPPPPGEGAEEAPVAKVNYAVTSVFFRR